jgi:hypothetical protein
VKGAGVDCAMLLVRVYCDLGLVPPFDPRPYTRDWMLHRDEEKYLGYLLARASLVGPPGQSPGAGPGDVILFRIGRCFAHGGIVTKTEPLSFVHAFAAAKVVLEDDLRNSELAARLPQSKFASYWAASPAERGRGTMRSMVEGAADGPWASASAGETHAAPGGAA